ncbi:MAG TPA: 4,5-DOPA dioxygenase extradiol [Gammaproteobacteria bacterium]|nr:4,5-DOPA dioxygenase extradiol [Gammaproteobacteria bacterium]
MPISAMPAVFIGHGTPMNALDRNRYTEAWRLVGAGVPRPKAILAVSAHWYVNATAVTAMDSPRTIHDFYGFPQALFDVEYPAPGAPDIAAEVAEVVKPVAAGLDRDSWGIDHGTWSVLVHMFPNADIPVVQLAINALKPFDYHFDLGRRLASLRDRNILVLCSGNVVHNLRRIEWAQPDAAFDWNQRFDEAATAIMESRPDDIPGLQEHPDFHAAVPTPDHFIPLLYLAGLAAAAGEPTKTLITGFAMGSLSMTAYGLGVHPDLHSELGRGAPPLGESDGEQSNI